ncbi:uncharacterized protein UV8b_03340 [Ustilaginoidea virens]|uniref:Uncharacterized protein n=1 Tax=Ustilaginoidea virens TaxID=1159556 RepID=A0A8E5HP61_USTVR|nr:uncharacterized protein UV8b_03340 [Ustilaginoidea virens]QUC19099.1 hypothetical protein UV8b_03340 [Ustilaginoidea virens]
MTRSLCWGRWAANVVPLSNEWNTSYCSTSISFYSQSVGLNDGVSIFPVLVLQATAAPEHSVPLVMGKADTREQAYAETFPSSLFRAFNGELRWLQVF